jgi:hypothetical protein
MYFIYLIVVCIFIRTRAVSGVRLLDLYTFPFASSEIVLTGAFRYTRGQC